VSDPRASELAVVAESLGKRFGATTALGAVTFDVRSGELFGFIGPDGGGKTTLFRILTTLLVPDAGRAEVLGLEVTANLWQLRRRVGYMAGRFSLYPDLSVRENLDFFASVFGTTVEREYAQIEPIYRQIEPFATRRASDLSGGMKQKLALCCALVHRPDILFLDEPTTGVDAVSRREFWDLLASLKASGLTIVVSTPYMDEAARCDRIALIQKGKILAIDTPDAVIESFGRPLLTVHAAERHQVLGVVRQYPETDWVYPFGETLHFTDRRREIAGTDAAAQLERFLHEQGVADAKVATAPATIEDVFIDRMGAPEAPEPAGAPA